MGNCAGLYKQKARENKNLQKIQATHPTKATSNSIQTQSFLKASNANVLDMIIEQEGQGNDKPKAKQQFIEYKHFSNFIFEIEKELRANQKFYGKFLDIKIIIEILQYFSKLYINHESAVEIINIVLDFMSHCRNKITNTTNSSPEQTNFSAQHLSQLSQRWIKVRQSVYFFNKDHLRLLNYIIAQPASQKMEYSHCFTGLKFDLSTEEVSEVANVVKKMCQTDVRAFSYLSNYLYSSCASMEKNQRLSINKIEQAYLDTLEFLISENPPAPPIQADQNELQVHQSFKCPQHIPKCQLNLNQYTTWQEKQFALEALIMSKAEESMQQFDLFNLILKQICLKNYGYRFKSGVKIKSKTQKKSMTRIKEKMLANVYNEIELEKRLTSSIRDAYLRSFIDIYSFTKQEYNEYQIKMKKIFNKMDAPIQFKVSDMLRGKCVFSSVEKINKCCQDIKAFVQDRQGEGYRLIQIDNRLKKENSDLVMKILFGNIIGELQLVKDLNTADYQFSHKLYELHRSKFFTPLTQLSIFNQNISKDYFLEVKALILENSIKKGYNYQEKIEYQQSLENFKDFFNILEIKINFFETHPSQIDIKMMRNEVERFKKMIQYHIDKHSTNIKDYELLLNNGIYFLEMKEYSNAIKSFEPAIAQFEKLYFHLIETVKKGQSTHRHEEKSRLEKYVKIHLYWGRTCEQMGNYEQAHNHYKIELKVKEKIKGKYHIGIATTLNNIGNVYQLQGNYEKALQYYQKCLEIKEKVKGKDSIGIATTLNNIGQVYRSQSNFAKALQYYERCLTIQEIVKGKDSIQIAASLNNIGLVYKNQGDYTKALEYYERCLYLKEKIKGKDSIGIATTLNNIGNVYQLQGNYKLALQYYQKCLQIQQKIKGKDSISIATTLNNIGLIWDAQNNYTKALEYFQKCLELNKKAKGSDSVDIAPIFNNMGESYKNQGHYEQAIVYYKQAIRIYKKHGVKYRGLANSLSNEGYALYKIKKYKFAAQCFEESLETYDRMKMNEQTKTCAQYMAKCYKAVGQSGKMRDIVSRYMLKIWEI